MFASRHRLSDTVRLTEQAGAPWRPRRRRARLGLRARVTVTFGLGALALSATMAGLTYFTARQFVLNERQSAILRQAYVNASLARTTLRSASPDITQLLDSLDTVPGSRSVLELKGQWYATSISVGEHAIPLSLRQLVLTGTPATQHFALANTPQLAVGVPIPSVDAAYFEVFSLDELSRTLRILALALAGAALVTTVAGAVIGRWASGRVLRPLAQVSKTAETIAAGSRDVRLVADDDRELSALASSFNRMTDALQERIAHEERFTSDVSHELRSPLTTLATSLEVLESHRDEMTERTGHALDLLAAELRRFQHMVDDLMEISRVDTGSAELLLDEVDVGELARQAATAGGAAGVPVEVDPKVAGARLQVDKRRIERVVANLVANAAQHAGGVTRIGVEPSDGGVRLVVADRGPGVAPAERERVFERFYRGQAAGQRGATNGTGLGLSLVAEHVRLHGGRVWVEGDDSGGTVDGGRGAENRFVVELPVLAAATASPDDSDDPDSAAGCARGAMPPAVPATVRDEVTDGNEDGHDGAPADGDDPSGHQSARRPAKR
ncbi:MAG TPA: HAMP domain-containing sensor histidine kinase [Acidimicrobiales bacterium]|nr:HAMP domain-containing sensor histidine kinase [Acidimicrobiales bacterium]